MAPELTDDERREVTRLWQALQDNRQTFYRVTGLKRVPEPLETLHELFDEAYADDRLDLMMAAATLAAWKGREMTEAMDAAARRAEGGG